MTELKRYGRQVYDADKFKVVQVQDLTELPNGSYTLHSDHVERMAIAIAALKRIQFGDDTAPETMRREAAKALAALGET